MLPAKKPFHLSFFSEVMSNFRINKKYAIKANMSQWYFLTDESYSAGETNSMPTMLGKRKTWEKFLVFVEVYGTVSVMLQLPWPPYPPHCLVMFISLCCFMMSLYYVGQRALCIACRNSQIYGDCQTQSENGFGLATRTGKSRRRQWYPTTYINLRVSRGLLFIMVQGLLWQWY